MARIEIKPCNARTTVLVDGRPIENLVAYSIHQEVGMEIPVIELEFFGHKNDYMFENADIRCKMHPKTLPEAAVILRNELLQHGDWYDALISSIVGYLKEVPDKIVLYDVAEGLAKQLIGED